MQGTLWVQEHPWAQTGTARDAPGQLWDLFAFGLHVASVETFSLLLETPPASVRRGSQL